MSLLYSFITGWITWCRIRVDIQKHALVLLSSGSSQRKRKDKRKKKNKKGKREKENKGGPEGSGKGRSESQSSSDLSDTSDSAKARRKRNKQRSDKRSKGAIDGKEKRQRVRRKLESTTIAKSKEIDVGRTQDNAYVQHLRNFIVVLRTEAKAALCGDDSEQITYLLGDIFGASERNHALLDPNTWESAWHKYTEGDASRAQWQRVDVAHHVFAEVFGFKLLIDAYSEAEAIKTETVARAQRCDGIVYIFSAVMSMCILYSKKEAYPLILGMLWMNSNTKPAITELVSQAQQLADPSTVIGQKWKTLPIDGNPMGWKLDEEDVRFIDTVIRLPAVGHKTMGGYGTVNGSSRRTRRAVQVASGGIPKTGAVS